MASLPRGKSEDVPCAQDGGFGETREGKAGSLLWDRDVPYAWHGSQEVTLPQALCPEASPDLPFTSVATLRPEVAHGGARGRGSGPAGGRSCTPEESGRRQRLRDSAVTHKVESTTKQHCRV